MSHDPYLLCWAREHLEAQGAEACIAGLKVFQEARGRALRQLASFPELLLEVGADVVACSVKDIPLDMPDSLVVAAMLPRTDPREALVTKPSLGFVTSLLDLPDGAVVCTPSKRRRLQIRARYPHLVVSRGSPDLQMRLRRLHDGDYDACVAAVAGLCRWGFDEESDELQLLEVGEVMPAFGQGAVGLLCSPEDKELVEFLSGLDDATTRTCVESERALAERLELLGGAQAGGLAEFLPDGQLRLQCTVTWPGRDTPRVASAERLGTPEDSLTMAAEIAQELAGESLQSLLTSNSISSNAQGAMLAPESNLDSDSDGEGEPDSREVAPLPGAAERFEADAVDPNGITRYEGRVCAVFPRGLGGLVDLNSQVPARWCPEETETSSALELGSKVAIYCCQRQWRQFQAFTEQPPRLLQRGGGDRIPLTELHPGKGPFRAVVISCTTEGVLVDFNCEVPAVLVNNGRPYLRGEELRVYCHEVDVNLRLCKVCTNVQQASPRPKQRTRLEDLQSGVAYQGTVKQVMEFGAFVNFNCEVQGLIRAMDIDMEAFPSGLTSGHEVTVYVTKSDVNRRRVLLSMFRPQRTG